MRRLSFFAVSIFIWAGAASAAACRSEAPPVNAPAPAPASSSAVAQDAVGLWRISAQGDAKSCLLALNLDPSNGGYGVVLENCRLPDIAKARNWRLTSDGLELRGEGGAPLLSLHRRTVDVYEAQSSGVAYRMEREPLV